MKTLFNNSSKLKTELRAAKEIPWFLASHAFLIIIFFIFLDILLGALLFQQYVIIPETKAPEQVENNIQFRYNLYQDVLKQWQSKDQSFQSTQDQILTNPFI